MNPPPMSWTVFYAWQSDLPNNTNRGLIQAALEAAVAVLGADGAVVQDPRVDRDTLGVAGSPDIERTIFEKIEQAAVFVCDVSCVTRDSADRPSPNPNVLIELGYALRAIGPERVIMVMNKAFGGPELLPFDIRRKRVLPYDLAPEATDKAAVRAKLKGSLVEAVRMSLEAAVRARTTASSPSDPAAALVDAMERSAPTRRACTRTYVASLLAALDAVRPVDPHSDESVVEALGSAARNVAGFLHVAAAVAVHDAEEVAEELLHLFEGILVRYDPAAGFSGPFRRTDFDFAKFLGHEMFVGLVAAFVREEKWEALDRLLRTPLWVTGGSRPDRQVFFDRISEPTEILDTVRRDRLSDGRSKRISVRADVLKERYDAGELSALLAWPEFMQADLLLYLRGRLSRRAEGEQAASWSRWAPWSAVYLRDLPVVIQRAHAKRYAVRLATGLGVPLTATFAADLQAEVQGLADLLPRGAWRDPVGEDFDWPRIATIG